MKEFVDRYILIGQTPVPCEDLHTWGEWFETADRHVFLDYCWGSVCRVSTVFLGLDHNFQRIMNPELPPLLFETMTFWWPGGYNSCCRRYATWTQAERGHRAVLRVCRRWSALSFVLAAFREWWPSFWREVECWSERQYKIPRGIPLETFELMTHSMFKLRWRRRRAWWLWQLKRIWIDESSIYSD